MPHVRPSPKMSLISTPRLPSLLYSLAISRGQLLPDPLQHATLPLLDSLVSSLPTYQTQMSQHQKHVLQRQEQRRHAINKMHTRQSRLGPLGPLYHTLHNRFHALDPEVPPDALPDHLLGLGPALTAPPPPRGVYLHGDVGCGKSLLMDMTFACARDQGCAAVRIHFHSFMANVYQGLHWYDQMDWPQRVEKGWLHPMDAVASMKLNSLNTGDSSGGGLLCFDEFQVSDVADARILHGVLTRLLDQGTILCFTANRIPAELNRSQLMDDDFRPFLDLLYERCELVALGGKDYRRVLEETDGGKENKYYFSKDAGLEPLQKLWKERTGTEWDDVEQRVLPVMYGRQFVLERARGECVQITAEELLERPVGVADYRALAESVSMIFVTDIVNTFTTDTKNLARRFIGLIDVCYEEKVRLVMRTEAEDVAHMFQNVEVGVADVAEGLQFETEVAKEGVGSENREVGGTLYSGEDEAFAFDRAISRLREMATDGFETRGSEYW